MGDAAAAIVLLTGEKHFFMYFLRKQFKSKNAGMLNRYDRLD